MSGIIGRVRHDGELFTSVMSIKCPKENGLSWLEERATEVEEANLRYDALKIGTEGPALEFELKCARALKTNVLATDPMGIAFIEPYIHQHESESIDNPSYPSAKYSVKVFCSKKLEGCYARKVEESNGYLKMRIYYRRPDFGIVHFTVEGNT